MSYKAIVAPVARDQLLRIRSRSRPVADEVLDNIKRLAANPATLGKPIAAGLFKGRMSYSFRVSRPPWTCQVTVLYVYHSDEETIEIVALGVLDKDGNLFGVDMP